MEKTWGSHKNTKENQKNIGSDSLDVSPQTRDQSNKVPIKDSRIFSLKHSIFSKVRLLLSLQIYHINHNGVQFQISEECFPNQFPHPSKRSFTLSGITHATPKDLKTKFHNQWASPQWSKRWSIDSPSHLHMQHQSTK